MSILELREKRAKLVHDARAIVNKSEAEKRDLNAEERQTWDTYMADVEKLDSNIDTEERKSKLSMKEQEITKSVGRAVPSQPIVNLSSQNEYRSALKNWFIGGTSHADKSESALYRGNSFGIPVDSREIEIRIGNLLSENRTAGALTKGGSNTGAELAPTQFPQSFVTWLKYLCPILEYATIVPTTFTNDLPVPIVNDTGNTGAIVSENADLTGSQSVATSSVTLKAYKYTSNIQTLSIEFILSAIGNFESTVSQMLADRIARAFAAHAVATGTNSGQPQSLVSAATSVVTLGTRGTITGDDVFDLYYNTDQPYGDRGTFVAHRSVVSALRKLKSTTGQYLWSDGLQTNEDSTLMGAPVLISQDMSTLSTSGAKKVLLYGDLSLYNVRTVDGVRITRDESRFMEYGLVAYSAIQFLDGKWTGPTGALSAITNPAS